MRHRARRAAFVGLLSSLIGCGLLVDVDGLSGGADAPSGLPEAATTESSAPEAGDGGTTADGDAAPCVQPAGDPTLLSDAIGLAGGLEFTCAVRANGTVVCWGENASSQLGSAGPDHYSPGTVPGLTGITAIAAGDEVACALDSGGHMWCWGSNDDGQIGLGAASAQDQPPTQIKVAGTALGGITAIGVGGRHVCAISAGSLLCWGANNYTQLGRTTTPFVPTTVTGVTGVVDLSLGKNYTCALADDPTKAGSKALFCWGQNDFGQLGYLGFPAKDPQRIQMRVGAKDGLPLMASGFGHTCARDEANHLLCWGENDFGQLGPGLTPGPGSPIIQDMTAFGVVRMATIGDDYTCAIEPDGKVNCLGVNGEGQLGNGTRDVITVDGGSLPPHTSITPVSGLPPAGLLAAGGAHTCAILTHACPAQGGPVMCWGSNSEGQLGNGNASAILTPVSVRAP